MSQNTPPGARDRVKWEAVAWLLLAGLAYWAAQPFDRPLRFFAPGAAFWPKVIITLMLVSGVVLLVSRFLPQSRREEEDLAYLDEVPHDLPAVTWQTVAVFVLPLVWTYGMHKMGFLLVTPVFILAYSWLMGVRKPTTLIAFSLAFYVVLVLVFYVVIFTPLPMGAGMFHTINGELMALIQ